MKAEALHRGRLGDPATVSDAAGKALSSSLAASDDATVLRALQVTAEVAHDSADTATINRTRSDCARIATETKTPEIKASASMTQAFCAMVLGDYGVAAELFAAGAAGFRSLGRDIDLRRALNGLGMCLSTTGDSDGATGAFQEAVLLAEKIGDKHAESIQWDNLAVLYEDMGWFDRAAEAYRRALMVNGSAPAPPREAQILANAASLAVTLGNLQEARSCLDRAVSLARTSQLPGLTIATLVARSDLHVADSDHDSAWAWAEEAVILAAKHPDRARRIGDFERVRRHFVWATQGYDAFAALCRQTEAAQSEIRRSQELERLAFEEWVRQVEGCPSTETSAIIELVHRKLFGAIAHLVALNVYPGFLPMRQPGETSAQLVIRAFPECRSGLVPKAVGALQ
jgi:tetratricopeptide (TPR) repeat protein